MSESPLDNDELFALEVELTSLDSFLIEICAFSQESVNLEALLNYTRGICEKTDALHFTSTDNLAEAPIQNPDFTKKLETYNACYRQIAQHLGAQTLPLLHVDSSVVDPATVDFNNICILFGYGNYYYIIFEYISTDTRTQCLGRAWVNIRSVGSYLKLEWESLLKYKVGSYGGAGVAGAEGWWHVHSDTVQRLRFGCLKQARDVELQAQILMEQFGRHVSVRRYRKKLEKDFGRVLDLVYGVDMINRMEKEKESIQFMEEYMVYDD